MLIREASSEKYVYGIPLMGKLEENYENDSQVLLLMGAEETEQICIRRR